MWPVLVAWLTQAPARGRPSRSGQAAAEYGVALLFVALVAILALGVLGARVAEVFRAIVESVRGPL